MKIKQYDETYVISQYPKGIVIAFLPLRDKSKQYNMKLSDFLYANLTNDGQLLSTTADEAFSISNNNSFFYEKESLVAFQIRNSHVENFIVGEDVLFNYVNKGNELVVYNKLDSSTFFSIILNRYNISKSALALLLLLILISTICLIIYRNKNEESRLTQNESLYSKDITMINGIVEYMEKVSAPQHSYSPYIDKGSISFIKKSTDSLKREADNRKEKVLHNGQYKSLSIDDTKYKSLINGYVATAKDKESTAIEKERVNTNSRLFNDDLKAIQSIKDEFDRQLSPDNNYYKYTDKKVLANIQESIDSLIACAKQNYAVVEGEGTYLMLDINEEFFFGLIGKEKDKAQQLCDKDKKTPTNVSKPKPKQQKNNSTKTQVSSKQSPTNRPSTKKTTNQKANNPKPSKTVVDDSEKEFKRFVDEGNKAYNRYFNSGNPSDCEAAKQNYKSALKIKKDPIIEQRLKALNK